MIKILDRITSGMVALIVVALMAFALIYLVGDIACGATIDLRDYSSVCTHRRIMDIGSNYAMKGWIAGVVLFISYGIGSIMKEIKEEKK